MSCASTSTSGCHQFQLVFNRLVSAVSFGIVDGASVGTSRTSTMLVQWKDSGEIMLGSTDDNTFAEIPGYKNRIREGDTVTVQLDAPRQTIVFRKNGAVSAVVAGPAGSGALVVWEALPVRCWKAVMCD